MSDELVRRLTELEREVKTLRAERTEAITDRDAEVVTRRRLLRGAGIAAVGAAGALATPALTGRATAADGGNVILGQANTATSRTLISRTSGTGPAVELAQSADGAPLRLSETLGSTPPTVTGGDLLFHDAFFYVGWGPDALATVHESSFATYPYLFTPWRLLDTRAAGESSTDFGRSRVSNPDGKFDASGRLVAGAVINVRLNDFSTFASGAIVNITVTGSSSAGHVRIWDTGSPAPNTSILNYTSGQTVANATTIKVGRDSLSRDSISLDVYAATHVIIDISGVVISRPGNLVSASTASSSSASSLINPTAGSWHAPEALRTTRE